MILSTLEYTPKIKTIPISELYLNSELDYLERDLAWEFSEFRPPKQGEMYWGSGIYMAIEAQEDFPDNIPRIILKKKTPKIDPSRYTCNASEIYGKEPIEVPEGFEFTGEFRLPKASEMFLNSGRRPEECYIDFTNGPKLILKEVR